MVRNRLSRYFLTKLEYIFIFDFIKLDIMNTYCTIKSLFLLLIVFLGISCLSNTKQFTRNTTVKPLNDSVLITLDSSGEISQITTLVGLLGKYIDSLPEFNGYKKEKVIFEGDERLADWVGVNYFYNDQLFFVAESNWVDKNHVSRVSLYTNQLKSNNLFVGQIFKNIRDFVSDSIPSVPDGQLFVKYKNDPRINIQLDISKEAANSRLYYGVNKLSDIPDRLKVSSIVIMN